VRVATWNVRHGRPQHGFSSNRRLAAAVAALDVDVLGVQEVDHRIIRSWFADQPALVARAVRAATYEYAPARRVAITGSDGVALAVRAAASFRTLGLPHTWGQRRVAVVATLDHVTVITTHLQNQADEARQQLDWLLDELSSITGPRVLMGDLNLRPDDVAAPLGAAGYTLAGGGPTNPAHDPCQQLDHIAVAGLTVESVVVGEAPVSDHRPLIATLRE
jgi:endonuclease/exonuclease/phosphatase family metal-dependent hydrolase